MVPLLYGRQANWHALQESVLAVLPPYKEAVPEIVDNNFSANRAVNKTDSTLLPWLTLRLYFSVLVSMIRIT